MPGICRLAGSEVNYKIVEKCARRDSDQGNAVRDVNVKCYVENIFVIVPNLEDFRIDRVHPPKVSWKIAAAHRFSTDRPAVSIAGKHYSHRPLGNTTPYGFPLSLIN
jgi:hypothetical protein